MPVVQQTVLWRLADIAMAVVTQSGDGPVEVKFPHMMFPMAGANFVWKPVATHVRNTSNVVLAVVRVHGRLSIAFYCAPETTVAMALDMSKCGSDYQHLPIAQAATFLRDRAVRIYKCENYTWSRLQLPNRTTQTQHHGAISPPA